MKFFAIFQTLLRVIGGLNMIRGFFIFLVFICKPSIWQLTKQRHPKLVGLLCKPFPSLIVRESSPMGTGNNENSNRDGNSGGRRMIAMAERNGNGTAAVSCCLQTDYDRIETVQETQVWRQPCIQLLKINFFKLSFTYKLQTQTLVNEKKQAIKKQDKMTLVCWKSEISV
jgi:hypothetical protein